MKFNQGKVTSYGKVGDFDSTQDPEATINLNTKEVERQTACDDGDQKTVVMAAVTVLLSPSTVKLPPLTVLFIVVTVLLAQPTLMLLSPTVKLLPLTTLLTSPTLLSPAPFAL